MADLTTIFHHLQRRLFPALEAELGTLSALDQQFCKVFSLTDLDRFARRYEWCGNGAPPCPRTWRRTLSLPSMSSSSPHRCAAGRAQVPPLLRQLCGWDSADEVPSEPTFSRAFAQFADDQLPQQTHEQMAKTHAGPKLVGHVSRDATAIKAPERPAAKPAPSAPAAPRKHGRPKSKGEVRPLAPPKRLELQPRAPWRRIWTTCPPAATWVASATAKGTGKVGLVTNCIWTPWTGISRSAQC